MKITELDLEKLGFQKVVVSPEESGDTTGYYYFEYEFSEVNDDFCLISMESDEIKDDTWKVQLFQTPEFEFADREHLKMFIDCVLKFKQK